MCFIAAITGVAAIAAVAVGGPAAMVVPILKVVGFSAIGPVAGSYAAASMGPAVASGSWFAWAQATAMAV